MRACVYHCVVYLISSRLRVLSAGHVRPFPPAMAPTKTRIRFHAPANPAPPGLEEVQVPDLTEHAKLEVSTVAANAL